MDVAFGVRMLHSPPTSSNSRSRFAIDTERRGGSGDALTACGGVNGAWAACRCERWMTIDLGPNLDDRSAECWLVKRECLLS